jgi:FixJ family two-component response regulator
VVPEHSIISIIEDDVSVREALGGLMKAFGFDAAVFSSAGEFLRSGRLDEMACLVVDVQMPGIGGIELQSRLLALGCRIPIIFITAFPDAATRTRAMQAGAVCFLAKPFGHAELLACIQAALEGRATADGARPSSTG